MLLLSLLPIQWIVTPATVSLANIHDPNIEILGGLGVLGLADDLVEYDPQSVTHQGDRLAEDHCRRRCHPGQGGVVNRPTETDGDLGGRRVVRSGVSLFAYKYVIDAIRGVGQCHRNQLDVTLGSRHCRTWSCHPSHRQRGSVAVRRRGTTGH